MTPTSQAQGRRERPMLSVSAALFPDLEGHWFSVREDDPRAFALYLRHYSSSKARGLRTPTPLRGNAAKFVGPGASLVLLTPTADAVFVWRKQDYRKDGQVGVECSIFRNEGRGLSSDLIREADALAWSRWPGQRHFTFVWDSKVKTGSQRGRNAVGWCYRKAGWKVCGRNADGRLTILEILPTTIAPAPLNSARHLREDGASISGSARHTEEASDVTAPSKPGQREWRGTDAPACVDGQRSTDRPATSEHSKTPLV